MSTGKPTNEADKPAIGFQGRILLKAQSEIYQRENLGATFILITGNKLSDRFSLISNWGLTWAGNGASGRLFYALNLSYSLSEKWGTFLEMYGDLNNFNANVDTGLSFLVSEDVMLDASTGWQGDNNLNDWFVDLGISFRFHNRD